MNLSRRQFTAGLTASLAFSGLSKALAASPIATDDALVYGYGPLQADENNIVELPKGFTYKIISKLGEVMSDGYRVTSAFDGMGCFDLGDGKVALVRNHEMSMKYIEHGPFTDQDTSDLAVFDRADDGQVIPGGTTTLIYDLKSGKTLDQYQSLVGTIRNCSGGITPWGSWLTCEEDMTKAGDNCSQDHGWVFEVPAKHKGLVEPKPLKAMGRFNHEAAAVDPETGIVYLTEDRNDSLFYRFIPTVPGELDKGGKLQALAFAGDTLSNDTRNWEQTYFAPGSWKTCRWVDMEDVESPYDNLRKQGAEKGAAIFARGEGIHYGVNKETGKGEFYFCCTSGGAKKLGQIFRLVPEEAGDKLQLFVESASKTQLDYGDNVTVAPNGHLYVCEDQYQQVVNNHVKGITADGKSYNFCRTLVNTEFAGGCFSPDGGTFFVNLYHPGMTLAIQGPWDSFKEKG